MPPTAPHLSLLTDLYQLTMASGYWHAGIASREACFHLHFRRSPFGGGYAIAAGLADALDYLSDVRFTEDDREYLAGLKGADQKPLFSPDFLAFLRDDPFRLDIDAIPEGTVVHPHEPLLRVSGPLWQAQLVETALLNIVNFQTLVATKAARICRAAAGAPVVEFGLRRAQGVDGALSASRAAYVGGCSGTSNVLAGQRYGIPVLGTHAHSWVMAFGDEERAFEAYAAAMPNNSVLLVDTYDTRRGVERAIAIGRDLRAKGHELRGVRLDSGDLGALSRDARQQLDAAGMPDANVVASNDLDEYRIAKLRAEGARIDIYGVGTRLTTCYDQPALGGVYKLASLTNEAGEREPRIKLSEMAIKVSLPGRLGVKRLIADGQHAGDLIYDVDRGPTEGSPTCARSNELAAMPSHDASEELLVPALREGRGVYDSPPLATIRERTQIELAKLPEDVAANDPSRALPLLLDAHVAATRDALRASQLRTS